jgi:hypothetical protein
MRVIAASGTKNLLTGPVFYESGQPKVARAVARFFEHLDKTVFFVIKDED